MRGRVIARSAPAMRVFMTTDSIGGIWTYSLDLAHALSALGVATTVAVLGRPAAKTEAAEARRIAGLRLIDTDLPLDWLVADSKQASAVAAGIADLARDEAADIVHLNSPALAGLADFPKPVVGVCHSCLATWWDTVRGGSPPDDLLWRIELLRQGYAACARLIAPSASFAAMTERFYGDRPLVIHNGCREHEATSEGAQLRGRFVLTAGRLWDDGKNIAALDDAAAFIDAPIVAAGSLVGPVGGSKQLRHVRPLGHLDSAALQEWMTRAPIFASMALYEPFGLSVLEAAQSGCALVLSDIPTFRELWSGAAIFVPLAQPSRLVRTLQRLLEKPKLARELGDRARNRATGYTTADTAAAMHTLYLGLSNRTVARAPAPERASSLVTS